ncbi:hypothetical protein [Sphingobacterium sp.]|uniref:hypothetical protein n=1 Tax=Sphingobacterium sp. TaxID=341027 RepID=UPI00289BB483|nr:hypothetical protein [Sphingobacterium sp.]
MITVVVLSAILLLLIAYFYFRSKFSQGQFHHYASMQVNYLFQDRPGQYSGDYRTKSGVFVFKTERKDEELRNVVIKQVKPNHPALVVNLEQIVVVPFESKSGDSDVSVRFKLLKKKIDLNELEGKGIRIAGVLNFANRKSKNFSTVLPIGEMYQSQVR